MLAFEPLQLTRHAYVLHYMHGACNKFTPTAQQIVLTLDFLTTLSCAVSVYLLHAQCNATHMHSCL